MIPSPPPAPHKLSAAMGRFKQHIARTHDYITLIRGTLPASEDDPNVQYLYQTIVLMMHTFLEEYYKHIVRIGTLWCSDDVRSYLMKRHVKKADDIEIRPLGLLMQEAALEVGFKKSAARLKGILDILVGVSPFADTQAEQTCLDLINVRNVITHQGGQPDEVMSETIRSPGIVITEELQEVGGVFYHLHISGAFLGESLAGIARSIDHIENALNKDPRYAI